MNEQSTTKKYIALRMERQHLLTPANETEYDALYRKPLKNATMTQAFYHGKRRSSPPRWRSAVQTVNFGVLPQRFMGEKP